MLCTVRYIKLNIRSRLSLQLIKITVDFLLWISETFGVNSCRFYRMFVDHSFCFFQVALEIASYRKISNEDFCLHPFVINVVPTRLFGILYHSKIRIIELKWTSAIKGLIARFGIFQSQISAWLGQYFFSTRSEHCQNSKS